MPRQQGGCRCQVVRDASEGARACRAASAEAQANRPYSLPTTRPDTVLDDRRPVFVEGVSTPTPRPPPQRARSRRHGLLGASDRFPPHSRQRREAGCHQGVVCQRPPPRTDSIRGARFGLRGPRVSCARTDPWGRVGDGGRSTAPRWCPWTGLLGFPGLSGHGTRAGFLWWDRPSGWPRSCRTGNRSGAVSPLPWSSHSLRKLA